MKLYEEILKNADIGIDAINNVQCAVKDEKFLNVLCEQKKNTSSSKLKSKNNLTKTLSKTLFRLKCKKL